MIHKVGAFCSLFKQSAWPQLPDCAVFFYITLINNDLQIGRLRINHAGNNKSPSPSFRIAYAIRIRQLVVNQHLSCAINFQPIAIL